MELIQMFAEIELNYDLPIPVGAVKPSRMTNPSRQEQRMVPVHIDYRPQFRRCLQRWIPKLRFICFVYPPLFGNSSVVKRVEIEVGNQYGPAPNMVASTT